MSKLNIPLLIGLICFISTLSILGFAGTRMLFYRKYRASRKIWTDYRIKGFASFSRNGINDGKSTEQVFEDYKRINKMQ